MQSRLDPARTDASRSNRKYNLAHIAEAIALAEHIGASRASRVMHIPKRRLIRLRCAYRRGRQTLQEAMADLDNFPLYKDRPDVQRRVAAKLKADLAIRVEAAREAYQIHKRTGIRLRACLKEAATKRGLNGRSLGKLVEEGRIPLSWLKNNT